jgi:hypothetical protein
MKMHIKYLAMTGLCTVFLLLTSCATNCCGYYDYRSQCGLASCADNAPIEWYSNPCAGPYDCYYRNYY